MNEFSPELNWKCSVLRTHGVGAPTHAIARFENEKIDVTLVQAARGRQPGSTRADNYNVGREFDHCEEMKASFTSSSSSTDGHVNWRAVAIALSIMRSRNPGLLHRRSR